jgi:hypothetical protein
MGPRLHLRRGPYYLEVYVNCVDSAFFSQSTQSQRWDTDLRR